MATINRKTSYNKKYWESYIKSQIQIPKRIYKNLEDYCTERYYHYDNKKWPCIHCNGSGSYHNSSDRDPYEGYKLAPRYKCNACHGSGKGPKSAIVQLYKDEVSKLQENIKNAKKCRKHALEALAKLSSIQMKALSIALGPYGYS